MLSRLGIAPHVAELCMNHQETETMRRVYDYHDKMKEAWDKAGAHIAALRIAESEWPEAFAGQRIPWPGA